MPGTMWTRQMPLAANVNIPELISCKFRSDQQMNPCPSFTSVASVEISGGKDENGFYLCVFNGLNSGQKHQVGPCLQLDLQ